MEIVASVFILDSFENTSSSHCSFSIKKAILRNFGNFTGKHLYWSLFAIELQAKRLKHRCFPVEYSKFLKTEVYDWLLLKPVLSPGASLLNHTCGSIWYLVFVSQFTVLLANSPFITNTIDTAITRSSRLVVFYKKGALTNFAKFTRKHLR